MNASNSTTNQPALSIPATAKEFLSMLPRIEAAAALIEAAYIAGDCAQLQELSGKFTEFHHVVIDVVIETMAMIQRPHYEIFISTSPKKLKPF